ncbi:hypothetical protein RRG08_008922 [Elysia crispata]|uniref:Uncharacterized protein n=1 Tax=Elysia crispata TaxID=231223 RepID=A0AAE1DNA9_9GAST|nr:hypothetical protein RRG08_008922 [Elysia crispata]
MKQSGKTDEMGEDKLNITTKTKYHLRCIYSAAPTSTAVRLNSLREDGEGKIVANETSTHKDAKRKRGKMILHFSRN